MQQVTHVDRRAGPGPISGDPGWRPQARLHEKISFEDLAAEVGLSRSRMARLFKAAIGQPPGAYVQTLRMTRAPAARAHLVERARSDGAGGHHRPSHFARDFRNAHGLSPRAFRQQLRLTRQPTPFLALVSSDPDAHC